MLRILGEVRTRSHGEARRAALGIQSLPFASTQSPGRRRPIFRRRRLPASSSRQRARFSSATSRRNASGPSLAGSAFLASPSELASNANSAKRPCSPKVWKLMGSAVGVSQNLLLGYAWCRRTIEGFWSFQFTPCICACHPSAPRNPHSSPAVLSRISMAKKQR